MLSKKILFITSIAFFVTLAVPLITMEQKQLTPTQKRMQQRLQQRQQEEKSAEQERIQQLQIKHIQISQKLALSPEQQILKNKNKELLDACTYGDIDKVTLFIKQGIDPNAEDNQGLTALHFASNYGHLEIVKLLTQYGANITTESFDKKRTALHLACQAGHFDVANFLINQKLNINAEDNEKVTPLDLAVKSNNLNLIKLLVANNANVNAQNINNWTILDSACQKGNFNIVKFLIDKDAKINTQTLKKITPLHIACTQGNEHIVQLLIENGANMYAEDYQYWMPLDYAAQYQYLNILKILAQHGCTPETTNKKRTINFQSLTLRPLFFDACQKGDYETVNKLLHNGIDIETQEPQLGARALHFACGYNHPDIIKLLLRKGADVNAPNFNQATPLHTACQKNNIEILNILLYYKANSNAQDKIGNTPLHNACLNYNTNSVKTIETVLKNGASINATNNGGATPLHCACQNGYLDTIICLIKHKANINAQDAHGTTPLCSAIIYSHKPIVEYLLQSGADLSLKRYDEMTALHFAYYQEDDGIRQLLIRYGAQEITTEQAQKEEQTFFEQINQEDPQIGLINPQEEEKVEKKVSQTPIEQVMPTTATTTTQPSTLTKTSPIKTTNMDISPKSRSVKQKTTIKTPTSTKKISSSSITNNGYQVLQDKKFTWPKFLTKPQQDAIKDQLRKLKHWPDTDSLDIKALKGEKKGTYRIRVGSCRIIFFVDEKERNIFIIEIGPRKNIYKKIKL